MSEQDPQDSTPSENVDAASDEMTGAVPLQEQDYDSFLGSGIPTDSDGAIFLQDAQPDTIKKSQDPDSYETRDGGSDQSEED